MNGSVENGDLAVSVAVSVANTGQVAGAEVVQVTSATSRAPSPGPYAN